MNGGRRQRERRAVYAPLVRLALVLGGLPMCGALACAPVARGARRLPREQRQADAAARGELMCGPFWRTPGAGLV